MAAQGQIFLDRIKESLFKYEKDLQLDQYNLLNQAHQHTKQPRIYLLLAGQRVIKATREQSGIVAAFIVIQLLGLSFISNLFAFVPIYASFKALRSPDKEDDEFWLTYWVVYGSLGLFESCLDTVFFWMPFYFIFKIAFLIWAYAPQTKGAQVIYHRFLGPLFGTLVENIDEARAQAARKRVQ